MGNPGLTVSYMEMTMRKLHMVRWMLLVAGCLTLGSTHFSCNDEDDHHHHHDDHDTTTTTTTMTVQLGRALGPGIMYNPHAGRTG